uniref:Variant surface glycoprotein n=1 Tax=Trypanosoma brucei rhodesiense TaxID=31286 RepID=C6YXH8_TRYBR|nr:variant surface glycoprotein [Trypanosoma brucei rhodesiense]
MQRILLAVICLVFWHSNTAEGNGPAIKQAEYLKVCKLAQSLRKMPGAAKFKLGQRQRAAKEMSKAILKLRVAEAATLDRNASITYGAMANAISNAMQAHLDNDDRSTEAAIDAATAAAAAAGRIAEMAEFLTKAAKGGSNTGHCIAAAVGGANIASNARYTDDCYMNEYTSAAADYNFEDGTLTATGFNDLNDADAKDTTATNRCILTKRGGAAAATDVFQSDGPHALAAATIVITANNGNPTIKLANAQNNIAKAWQVTGDADNGLKRLYKEAVKLRQITAPPATRTADDIIKATVDPAEIKKYIAAALRATNSKLTNDKAETEAEALANNVFTMDSAKTDKVFNTIQKINTVKVEAEQIKPLRLEALTDEVDLLNALSYHTATNRNKMSAKAPACPEQDKTEEVSADKKIKECSGKKGDECKGECELVEGICKPANKEEEENKEKDGKAASTCAGKKQGECEKENGCKWDGKECKDSSILVNKQFAFSVVSAAFMALLF